MSPFDKLYAAFAVPPDYSGPLAQEFHEMVARKYLQGMRSGHSSVAEDADVQGLVREHLAIEWEISHGCAPRHRHFMPEINRFDLRWSVLKDRWSSLKASIRSRYHKWFAPNPYKKASP